MVKSKFLEVQDTRPEMYVDCKQDISNKIIITFVLSSCQHVMGEANFFFLIPPNSLTGSVTVCGATGCGATGCGVTGCGATGCGATVCGATGCGVTGCGVTGCGVTGYRATRCGVNGCGVTGCGVTGCVVSLGVWCLGH